MGRCPITQTRGTQRENLGAEVAKMRPNERQLNSVLGCTHLGGLVVPRTTTPQTPARAMRAPLCAKPSHIAANHPYPDAELRWNPPNRIPGNREKGRR